MMNLFMKRKNGMFLSTLLALTASVVLAGCSRVNDPRNSGTEEPKAQQASVSFRLALPQGGKVVYSPTRAAIHDEAEWKLEHLYLYVFDANTGNIKGTPKDIKGDLTAVSGEDATWDYVFDYNPTSDTGVYRFAFVANENPGPVANETELHAKLASKTLGATGGKSADLLDAGTNIPMTGYAFQGKSTASRTKDIALASTVASAKVELTRIVARIDVQNLVTNLVIKDLELINTNSRSNLFVKTDHSGAPTYEAPTSATKVAIKGFTTLPAGGIQKGGELKKAFYLYEGLQPTSLDEYTTVKVTGTLAGKDVTFAVPFVRSSETPATPVTVKRNHLYRIVLGRVVETVEGAKAQFKIEDTPWNGVLLNEVYQVISFDDSFGSYSIRWSPTRRVLTTGTEYLTTKYSTTVRTEYKNHTKFECQVSYPEGVEWSTVTLTNKKDGTASLSMQVKDTSKVPFTSYLPEGKEETSCLITIWSDADPDNKVTLTHVLKKGSIPHDPGYIVD